MAESIRLMTWNVWWRFGGNWRERQVGLIDTVQAVQPDILGIQECWGDAVTTQARVLADEMGVSSAFVRVGLPPEPEPSEEPDQRGVVVGVGLVSRWPLGEVSAVPITSRGRELSALVARVLHPAGEVGVVVGATSWEPERQEETAAQIRELERLVMDAAADVSVLLADLNYDPTFPAIAALRLTDAWDAAEPGSDPRTLSSTNRYAPPEAEAQYDRRIDHILYRPGRARARRAVIVRDEPTGIPPSDHYPVVADLVV